MNEKNIIKKISALKAIKLDEGWKNNDKSRLFLLLEENSGQSAQSWLARAFDLRILFQPISRGVLAGFLVIFAFGIFLFNYSILKENIYDHSNTVGTVNNKENNREIGKTELGNEENNREIVNNKEISPFSQLTNKKGSAVVDDNSDKNNNEENEISSYASSLNNKEDDFADFRINLNERINRIWVISYESGNDEVFKITKEAEKLFNEKDYDAALRAIMVAESMLQ
ncbi:MAG: hypothetical protein US76_01820 [Parcubacteria group bacterium GW2011_GWA2_38_13b]|nr:MAG: hypothetical protein US76_01820 [Parcubacteria group bacterium GW2011_GWA2_38_13b]